MADPTPSPENGDDTGLGSDRDSTSATPRWVKVFGIIALVLVLLFVIALLAGGLGPGRHTQPRGTAGASPASVPDHVQ